MASSLTPADPEYWDDFYIDGDGHGDIYEWYTAYEVRQVDCWGLTMQSRLRGALD